ncbi:LysR family transcriptional regulator [Streptomyces sp. NPDC048665]|uniref:helix-turn-helix domain-containing protein n=1 Tax=Streptomyces sp. NPDC048665 TaxID=3155490 RepID=UPI0034474277
MELSDLRIFLAVARTHGITKAAQELHTVRSNVSARIHALEKQLGAPLFQRGGPCAARAHGNAPM